MHANGSVYTWIHPPPVGFVLPAYPVDGFVPKPVRVTTSQPPRAATTAASDGQESAYGIKARDAECEAVRTAVEGTRNATLNTAALKLAQLVAGGELDENTTRDMLRNAALDAELDDGTEPPQIDATIASGWAKGITEPRNAPQSTLGRQLVQRTQLVMTRVRTTPTHTAPIATTPRTPVPVSTEPEEIVWDEFWTEESETGDFIVEQIVPKGRQIAMYSEAKEGKSLLAIDACAALAMGDPYFGATVGSDPVDVVYISQEMTRDDLRDRLTDMGLDSGDDLSHLHYYQLTSLRPLDSDAGGRTHGDHQAAQRAACGYRHDGARGRRRRELKRHVP